MTTINSTYTNPLDVLRGQVALVTGGGNGLGAQIVRVLAEAGVRVVAADIKRDATDMLAAELKGNGADVRAETLDVRDEQGCRDLIEKIAAELGPVDILINNAGTDVTEAFEDMSVQDFERVLDVNLRGPMLLTHAAYPLMKARGRGHIVNVASTAAKRTWTNASAYHASKWGLLGFSHAMHAEARQHGVKVTAVVAGGMRTPFILDRFPDTPLENLQDPRNVAEAIRYTLTQPAETVIPELTVLPMRETSWP